MYEALKDDFEDHHETAQADYTEVSRSSFACLARNVVDTIVVLIVCKRPGTVTKRECIGRFLAAICLGHCRQRYLSRRLQSIGDARRSYPFSAVCSENNR